MANKQRKEQEKTESAIREGWLAAIAAAVKGAKVKEIENNLGDLDAILEKIGLKRKRMGDLLEAIRDAFKKGGRFEAKQANISFDLHNEAAEDWLREHSSDLIKRINDEQRDAIRRALESGMRQGNNPRQTALDIVGRVDGAGKRKGGIIGLTEGQADAVMNAREQLRSGDTGEMRKYLRRKKRDKRFDRKVEKAIEQGKALNAKDVDKIVGRYSSRLLKQRGDNIARTESMQSFHEARKQAWGQAFDDGEVNKDDVTKTWRASLDSRTRDSHEELDGKTIPVDELFESPTGARLDHPGDSEHGATGEDVINCRCTLEYRVDY